jgi:hypothetical protein
MKIKLVSIAMILALTAGFNANAANISDSSISSEQSEVKKGHKHGKKHGKKIKARMGKIVHAYMLEQGDITQGEIDLLKAEREANHAELKTLKEAGDTEGLAAKKAELKAKSDERRAAMKEYINNNEALKTQLQEKKKKGKGKRNGKHSKHKEQTSES